VPGELEDDVVPGELEDDVVPGEIVVPDDRGFVVGDAAGLGATFTLGAASGAGSGAGPAAGEVGAAINAPTTPASTSTPQNEGAIDATLPRPVSLSMLPVPRVRSSESPQLDLNAQTIARFGAIGRGIRDRPAAVPDRPATVGAGVNSRLARLRDFARHRRRTTTEETGRRLVQRRAVTSTSVRGSARLSPAP
jgi:hypothetical protein